MLISGDIVHNLSLYWREREASLGWAIAFNENVKRLIKARDHEALIDWKSLKDAELAIPTPEHYLPLLYVLGAQDDSDKTIEFFADEVQGSVSMTGVLIC